MKQRYFASLIMAVILMGAGCAYYNTFFNTEKFFDEAEKARIKEEKMNATKAGNRRSQQTREQQQQSRSRVSSGVKTKYNKAIEKASRLLEFYPDSKYVDDALLILGKSFFHREEYRKAKRKFEELLHNFPESEFVPEARLWLGKVSTELRDYKSAEQSFQQILNGQSKREIRDEAQFLLGGLNLHKNDYFSAAEQFRLAAQNAKDKALRSESYYQLGECQIKMKAFEDAAKAFEMSRKYSQTVETEYRAQFKAALTYKELKQYDTAINIFNELLGDLNNENNWPDCKLEIADCLYRQGDVDNAIEWYIAIPEEHKNAKDAKARAYYNLGLIFQADLADYDKSKEYYDEAVKLSGRTEFGDDARARQKAIQDLLNLKADIKEQKKRIAKGDSLAAVADVEEIFVKHTAMVEELLLDPIIVDSLWSILDDTTSERLTDSLEYEQIRGEALRKAEQGIVKRYFLFDSLYVDSLMYEHEFLLAKVNQIIDKANNRTNLTKGELGTPEEELVKDRLMLGELFLFDFNEPDSAMAQYLDILARDSTDENLSKSLFTIGYIYEHAQGDTIAADSVYRELLERYPESDYASEVRDKLGIPAATKDEEYAMEAFIAAEKDYLEQQSLDSAIVKYEQVIDLYPETLYASKSLFAVGWIYEQELKENEKALEIYQQLIDKYPDTDFAKMVKKKVDGVEKAKEQKEKGVAATDSTLLADASQAATGAEAGQSEYKIEELIQKDSTNLRHILAVEMEKDNPRLRNPQRIIGNF